MAHIELGTGEPVVVIPGVQGRWEWMRPGVEALARHCRVITFSLADERGAGAAFSASTGIDSYVDQVRQVMDAAATTRAVVCGVSYGGLIAALFAARYPERTQALVLVSAIPPTWRPNKRVLFYMRAPRLLSPLFCLASLRLFPEIAAASGGVLHGIGPAVRHAWNVAIHMFSPARMARRVHLLQGLEVGSSLASIQVPVLVITGEASLERVVPVESTRQYLSLWPHAESAVIARSGHLGVLTRPDEFARLVAAFVARTSRSELRRRVG